jgi:hypothetical protein
LIANFSFSEAILIATFDLELVELSYTRGYILNFLYLIISRRSRTGWTFERAGTHKLKVKIILSL